MFGTKKYILLTALTLLVGVGSYYAGLSHNKNHQSSPPAQTEALSDTAREPQIEDISASTTQQFLVRMVHFERHIPPASLAYCKTMKDGYRAGPTGWPLVTTTVSITYPQLAFLQNKRVQQKINASLYSTSQVEYNYFITSEINRPYGRCFAGQFETDSFYNVPTKFPSIFSVKTYNGWDHLLAHPAGTVFARSYDLKTGNPLTLSSLFKKDTKYIEALNNYINNSFKASGMNGQIDTDVDLRNKQFNSPEFFRRSGEEFGSFFVTNDGLIIQFDWYTVGGRPTGTPEVFIPYSYLKEYIDPAGPLADWDFRYSL